MSDRSRRTRGTAPPDHYTAVTAQVIAALDAGTPPWRQPWDPARASGPCMPQNAVTGTRYRGINTLLLGMSPRAFASGDPRWATYKQAAAKGWQVRKGERGTTAYFYKRLEVHDDATGASGSNTIRRLPLLRAFTLFHTSQIEGAPAFSPPTLEEAPWRAPQAAQTIVTNSGAIVRVGGDRAFYSPGTDHIQMPPVQAFESAAAYAGVLLHELAHWSGAESRLNRDLRNAFGAHDYAREELRAEIAQVMVCAEIGIAGCDFTNNASYIACWLDRLRSDRKEIFRAAADAQRIADYLLAFHPDYAARPSVEHHDSTDAEAHQENTGLAEAA